MNSWLQSGMRNLLINTNSFWPFSRLNRIPYYIALKFFIKECRKFSRIKSVYLRNSLAYDIWTPGLSDIDLTVIIESRMNADKEFIFLSSFWGSYARLQRWFPMLGEVDMLDDKQITDWTKFGIPGYESKYWKLLSGEGAVSSNYPVRPEGLARDALNYALKWYRDFFFREFYVNKGMSLELTRHARKILRYINYTEKENIAQIRQMLSCDKEELLCRLMIELEKRAIFLLKKSPALKEARSTMDHAPEEEYIVKLGSSWAAIESILLPPSAFLRRSKTPTYLVILKDGLDLLSLKTCVSAILEAFKEHSQYPVIFSSSIFYYMCCIEDPYRYYEIVKETRVIYGRNLIAQMLPPAGKDLRDGILNRAISTFINPRRMRIAAPDKVNGMFSYFIRMEMLKEALGIKLFLEKGELIGDIDSLLRLNPAYLARVSVMSKKPPAWEYFMLLNDAVDDIHRCMQGIGDENKNPR